MSETSVGTATTSSPIPSGVSVRGALTSARWMTVMLVLVAGSAVVCLAAIRMGTETIPLADVARVVHGILEARSVEMDTLGTSGVILVHVRLPRVLLAFTVGGCLAAVGVTLQALLRNPLADPYVLGISSGAALGAAVAMLLGVGTTVFSLSTLPLYAFAGALLSIAVVYRIAVSYGHLPIHTLLLGGVVLNAICSALIMFITSIMDPNRSYGMMAWLMGTLLAPTYSVLAVVALYLTIGGVALAAQASALNILTLGEEPARSLGVDVERVKKTVFGVGALLTGAVVSVSGLIGFVGMVVPHAVRLMIGPDHRLLLPASALVGGMFLTFADSIARTIFSPNEIPVGVVTALIGGPVFLGLLVRRKGQGL